MEIKGCYMIVDKNDIFFEEFSLRRAMKIGVRLVTSLTSSVHQNSL